MRHILLITFWFVLGFFSLNAARYKVADMDEFNKRVPMLVAGDTIVLKSGIWSNFVMHFFGEGVSSEPIVLMAEAPGKVIISGKSSLLISGNYLKIQDLVFKDGTAAADAVISFRNGKKGQVANNVRLTNCVVDNYGNKERWSDDNYVSLWGKNNRVDHCYFGEKNNNGVTLVVFLKGELNWPNHHSIDHNHFGPRPRLGSNGGETIRIGDSGTSLNGSHTILENNLFEHCNGETEIVSIKSSDNIIKNNLFYESEGSLVLRHGNRNIVEGNVFIGNFKPYTGGIRLVNFGHRISNNLFVALSGDGFRAPLSIMCGLENSPLNRYEPVRDVKVDGNMWIACTNGWDIGVPFTRNENENGYVLPEDVTFSNNVVWQNTGTRVVNYLTGVSRLNWENNYINSAQVSSNEEFMKTNMVLSQLKSIVWPQPSNSSVVFNSFVSDAFHSIYNNTFGPGFKSIAGIEILNRSLIVAPGQGTLNQAINNHEPGIKNLILLSENEYQVDDRIVIDGKLFITSNSWVSGVVTHPAISNSNENLYPVIIPASGFNGDVLFTLGAGSHLHLQGIKINGQIKGTSSPVKYAFATYTGDMFSDYNFTVNASVIIGFTHTEGAVVKGYEGSFARKIEIYNTLIENCFAGFRFEEDRKSVV